MHRSSRRHQLVTCVASVAAASMVVAGPALPAAAGDGSYAFLQSGRRPAFWWDGCQPIDVGIDLRFAARIGLRPDWERTRWRSALSELSHYSRYEFRLRDVRTSSAGASPRPVAGIEVVIAYGGAKAPSAFRYPRLRIRGVQAYGGPSWAGRQALRGSVVVNTPEMFRGFADSRTAPKWAGVDPVRAVYMHEFGHVLGLDHVDDSRQLMYPYLDESRDDVLGSGERTALRLLSRRPCFTPGAKAPLRPGPYVPDPSIMPVGDASSDPPERCPDTGDCPAEPVPPQTEPDPSTATPEPVPLG